ISGLGKIQHYMTFYLSINQTADREYIFILE
ncbi:hypothetical protein L917_10074, partial [Phytophthora nicotianae]